MTKEIKDTHEARWERIFTALRYETHYPFEIVIRFILRHYPREQERKNVKILEVGCGLGNNLRFIASEGFDAYGVDVSRTAIERASAILSDNGHAANLSVASAGDLPFPDETFDMVVDRGALTCIPDPVYSASLLEARRVLKLGGHFLFTPYADSHSSNGIDSPVEDGLTENITAGSLFGNDRAIRFLSFNEIRSQFQSGWAWKALQLVETTEFLEPSRTVNARWHAILKKV